MDKDNPWKSDAAGKVGPAHVIFADDKAIGLINAPQGIQAIRETEVPRDEVFPDVEEVVADEVYPHKEISILQIQHSHVETIKEETQLLHQDQILLIRLGTKDTSRK
jgi:hypothetical protein